MDKVVKVQIGNGHYLFKLRQLLEDRKVSINKLMRDTNTDFKVIQRIMDGTMVRVDIIVLARFCDYFDCEVVDIFEYKSNSPWHEVIPL